MQICLELPIPQAGITFPMIGACLTFRNVLQDDFFRYMVQVVSKVDSKKGQHF